MLAETLTIDDGKVKIHAQARTLKVKKVNAFFSTFLMENIQKQARKIWERAQTNKTMKII